MASRNTQTKRTQSSGSFEQRRLRRNQIIFSIICFIVLASMIISLVAK